jgi:4-hydroxybenzoate polyprenyltransferase
MQTPQNNLLNGRTLPRLIKWSKHVLIAIVILMLMILSLGLLGSWIAIILVCFFATAMICCIRGFMTDAEKSKEIETLD